MVRSPQSVEVNPHIAESVNEVFEGEKSQATDIAFGALKKLLIEENVIDSTDQTKQPEVSVESVEWAREEVEAALVSWENHSDTLGHYGVATPRSFEAFIEQHNNPIETLYRLRRVREALEHEGIYTEFVLVPWQVWKFAPEMEQLGDVVKGFANEQSSDSDVNIDGDGFEKPVSYYNSQTGKTSTMAEYVESKLSADGEWGIMLMDDSQYVNRDLREGIDEINSNAMGVYEFASMMIQDMGNGYRPNFSLTELPASTVRGKAVQANATQPLGIRQLNMTVLSASEITPQERTRVAVA